MPDFIDPELLQKAIRVTVHYELPNKVKVIKVIKNRYTNDGPIKDA